MALAEITEPVDLCLPDGRLDRRAVGWSRQPLHRTVLGGWGRNKRWEYFGLVTPTHVFGLTIASLDYAAMSDIYVLERATGREVTHRQVAPLGRGVVLPDERPPVHARGGGAKVWLDFEERDGGTALRGRAPGISLELFSPREGDCLAVVVPWSDRRFQYTVKDVARPLRGAFMIDGKSYAVGGDDAWAVLDRGRGRWPYSIVWNWGAGSGVVDGRRLGLQLGGKWTAGTGSTECALFVDGRATYYGDEPEWSYAIPDGSGPWRVRGERVDATLTPFHVRSSHANLLVLATTIHQAFGSWSGWAVDENGARVSLDGLVGWAEEARNRW
jgi:hypothetical protein